MSILGNRVTRREDPRLLTGQGGYVANVALDRALCVQFVVSQVAHGIIERIDLTEARLVAGVVGIYTAEDLDLPELPALLPPEVLAGFPETSPEMKRWALAKDRVRYVGEPIVAIVAEDQRSASDAVAAVDVCVDVLPAVVEARAAVESEVLLFPGVGSNVMSEMPSGDVDDPLVGADLIVRQSIVNQRLAPAPLEGRAAAAHWVDGRLTFWASTQGPFVVKAVLESFLGLTSEQVRVVAADVGGGFGAKGIVTAEELLVGWLALRCGRPVRWLDDRTETMVGMTHGRAQLQDVSMGFTRDGKIVGVAMDVIQDGGAFPIAGQALPAMTRLMVTGPYDIKAMSFRSRTVATTTTPIGAFRGAGRPEAAFALERLIDLGAIDLGLDPVELRRKNLIRKDAFPFNALSGASYDSGDYVGALDRVLIESGYDELREEQLRRRHAGGPWQMGIGVSVYVEITNPWTGADEARVAVDALGSAVVYTGSGPHGQGHETSWAMIASDRLGVPLDQVRVVYGDTDRVPAGKGVGGSRSLQVAGVAVSSATDAVVEVGRQRAAKLLEATEADVVLDKDRGVFHVVGTPSIARSWADVTAREGPINEIRSFEAAPTYPFGAHVAVVEVDVETGQVRLTRLIMVDDCGLVLNPLIVDGQIHGGAAQGVAQALLEEFVYDKDGNPATATFLDYAIPSAAEMPSFEIVDMETPTPHNVLGAKGIGESATIGSTPAVVNAVHDALRPFGIRHIDMPLTPMKIWQAIHASASPPEPHAYTAATGGN